MPRRLYLVCAGEGVPVMWCRADPKIDEREVLAVLLDTSRPLIREGRIIVADKGFLRQAVEELTKSKGPAVAAPRPQGRA